ncbi:Immunoglobulin superfamily containing leucine-rich repeat protein-like [Homarus americanus]|uniref:Immunoglobulin superfamily containing leucine-rich repeat protein-like n=1 Tax=Homarus americanus TaxID=6706 RepID=A0A8J5N9R8_HOMAM|nr:Immunoglobulin superfamily containing leucine-rich repeat protein-like [Homarus americanus]
MKKAVCILVMTCLTGVITNPVQRQHPSDTSRQQHPFFRTSPAEKKLAHRQITLDSKMGKMTDVNNNQPKTIYQSNSYTFIEQQNTPSTKLPAGQTPSSRSQVTVNKRPTRGEEPLINHGSTLRMALEAKKLTNQDSWLQDPSDKNNTCLFPCPNAESFYPCVCDSCNKSINCSALSNLTQLRQLFHNVSFPATKFTKFLLSPAPRVCNSRGTIFLDNTFGKVTFQDILVEFTDVEKLTNFLHLKTLEVSGGRLQTVPAMSVVPSLTNIYLNQNQISTIPRMAFADLPSLEVLDLGYNKLEEIGENQLHFSSVDVVPFLDDNNISFIHERAFSFHQPSSLDVSDNSLPALNQKVFQPILDLIIVSQDNRRYIDAEGNPLRCNDIEWLLNNPRDLFYTFLPDPYCIP